MVYIGRTKEHGKHETHGGCLLILFATNPYADTWMWLVILESEHILSVRERESHDAP